MEDVQIIELYFAREEQAIHETDAKYGRLCHHVAHQILADEEDVKECVNDTYFTVWNRMPPTRPTCFAAFLCKIVRNLSLKKWEYLSAKKRDPGNIQSLEELEYILPDHRIDPSVGEEQLGQFISDFLRTEKPEARKVFLRRYLCFDSIGEIAARYGFRESKVKSMLFRTRNRLREYLKKEGVEV